MKTRARWLVPGLFSVACVAALITSLSFAQDKEGVKKEAGKKEPAVPGLPAEFKLPPGWTPQDMQACLLAGTPGEMQKLLADGKGDWTGKTTMWMFPGSEPMSCDTTSTVTTLMDGRYTRVEVKGDFPGMGPYHGIGVYGYDNVLKKFVSSWIDNHSTGIMQGDGELSKDKKQITWNYTHSCPVIGKPATMKEVETVVSEKERRLEMWGNEPKTGKNFKMMQIDLTRK